MKARSSLPSLLLVALAVAGCGGSHSSGGGSGRLRGNGRAVIRVAWPTAKPNFVPVVANSMKITLIAEGIAFYSTTVDRPSGGGESTIPFDNLPVADVTAVADFYADAGAKGTLLATGTKTVKVNGTDRASILVLPGSRVATVSLDQVLLELKPNETRTVRLSALDANGAIVPLVTTDGARTERIVWESSDPAIAAFTDTFTGPVATIKSLGNGSTTIKATFSTAEPAFSAEATTQVDVNDAGVVGHPESALLDGGFPTPRGDAGRNARSTGSGATGQAGAVRNLGTGPKVIDKSGNLYVGRGTIVRAYGPDGGELWNADVKAGVSDLALTKDGRLYVVAGKLVTLRASDGTPFGVPDFMPAEAAASVDVAPDGSVILATATKLYELRPTDMRRRWFIPLTILGAPAIGTNGTIYVRRSGTVDALDLSSGAILWSKTLVDTTVSTYSGGPKNGQTSTSMVPTGDTGLAVGNGVVATIMTDVAANYTYGRRLQGYGYALSSTYSPSVLVFDGATGNPVAGGGLIASTRLTSGATQVAFAADGALYAQARTTIRRYGSQAWTALAEPNPSYGSVSTSAFTLDGNGGVNLAILIPGPLINNNTVSYTIVLRNIVPTGLAGTPWSVTLADSYSPLVGASPPVASDGTVYGTLSNGNTTPVK